MSDNVENWQLEYWDNEAETFDTEPDHGLNDPARTKAARAGLSINFEVMSASQLKFPRHSFDGIVCRHVLWMLPDLTAILQTWTKLLKRGAQVLLVEGFWHTGSGLHAEELKAALPSYWQNVSVVDLSTLPEYWGKEVEDERYAMAAEIT